MNSRQLFLNAGIAGNIPDFEVKEIVFDSRQAGPGKVFVALKGQHTDGHKYVKAALEAGCPVAVTEGSCEGCVVVPDTKIALTYLSHAFYGWPSKLVKLCGVTATNGKTTTTHMIATLLRAIDPKVGLVGTAGHYLPTGRIQPDISNPTTTPYPTVIDEYLSTMRDAGSKFAVLELSSFGLEGGRVIGLQFQSLGIGNITHCHHAKLHGTHENYVEIKLKSLGLLAPDGIATLNIDDEYYQEAVKHANGKRIITFGHNNGDIHLISYIPSMKGSNVTASIFSKEVSYEVPLPSLSNALNTLCAFGVVEGLGVDSAKHAKEIAHMIEIPGRWNWIDEGQPFTVVIDKANTPAALQTVIAHMDTQKPTRKIIVTNNVGEGDPKAREELARIASVGADLTVITYGVAKGEDLDFTVDQFAGFMNKHGGRYKVVKDRCEAIDWVIGQAREGDFIAILGRGDEDGMYVQGVWVEVDDRMQARKTLKERGY